MALVVGIDLGTSSTKTVVLDDEGRVLASASANYPMQKPHPGWVEQDTGDWWRAVCETTQSVVQTLVERRPFRSVRDIRGISLSGQMNGAVFVDASGSPLRSPLIWLDPRSQRECDAANARAGDLLRRQALQVLSPINTLAKFLWIRAYEPEVYGGARYVLIPKDWIRFRLTNTFSAEVSDGSVSAAMDLGTRDWSGEILDALEVRRAFFPEVVESPAVVGAVTREAAAEA